MVGGVENAVACAVSGRGYGSRLPRAGERRAGRVLLRRAYLAAEIRELALRDRYGEDPTWKPCRHYLLTLLLSPFSQTVKEKNIVGPKSSLESELSELGTPTGKLPPSIAPLPLYVRVPIVVQYPKFPCPPVVGPPSAEQTPPLVHKPPLPRRTAGRELANVLLCGGSHVVSLWRMLANLDTPFSRGREEKHREEGTQKEPPENT